MRGVEGREGVFAGDGASAVRLFERVAERALPESREHRSRRPVSLWRIRREERRSAARLAHRRRRQVDRLV